jgi:hypothetical protein
MFPRSTILSQYGYHALAFLQGGKIKRSEFVGFSLTDGVGSIKEQKKFLR